MKPSFDGIRKILIKILTEQMAEWGLEAEGVNGATRLSADLGFSSIDALQLMAVIDSRLGTKLPFEKLVMSEGEYVNDLTVDMLAEFAFQNFETRPQSPEAM